MRLFGILLLLFLTGCSSSKKELNLFVWGEYFSQQALARFEKEYDCRVNVDTYETNEAMYAKLKLGASGYDLVMPSNYIFEVMERQKMLRPIGDFPNMSYFNAEKAALLGIAKTPFGIPTSMTYAGLGVRPARIPDFIPSWSLFSRKDLRGRMTLLNDMREALGAALLFHGYSVNTKSEAELDRAVETLVKWKRNLAKFESEQYKSGIASAEFFVVQGYNTDILQVMEEEEGIAFVFPNEGVAYSVDFLAIPQDAPHPDLAEAFLNFMMDPKNAALNMNGSLAESFVRVDPADLKPILRNNPAFHPRVRTELLRNVGESLELYIEAWERVLSE